MILSESLRRFFLRLHNFKCLLLLVDVCGARSCPGSSSPSTGKPVLGDEPPPCPVPSTGEPVLGWGGWTLVDPFDACHPEECLAQLSPEEGIT